MSSASSPASKPTVRQTPATPAQPARPAPTNRQQPGGTLLTPHDEEALLKLNLSDLPIPKVGGLDVDGFKPSLLSRLFGKK
jgi:hypothetical protein